MNKETIKYSEIREWVMNFVENSGYDGIVHVYKMLNEDKDFEVDWEN